MNGCTWRLRKSFGFEASHQLLHHDGRCARLHGHSFWCEIEVVGNRLQETGPQTDMVMDFGLISQAIKKHLSGLDHSHLNDTLGTDSPTAEVLAQWIYRRLEPDLPGLVAVTIAETPLSSCRYEELGLVPL